jgi:hypothetical protein
VKKWDSPAWRFKIENKFDESIFDIEKYSTVKWVLAQKDRLQALWLFMSLQDKHLRILKKCGGDLEHAIKSRSPPNASTEDIINILEDITTRTRICRRFKPVKNYSTDKNEKSSPQASTSRDNPRDKQAPKKCFTCFKIGHTSETCHQAKKKAVSQVEAKETEVNAVEEEPDVVINDYEDGSSISDMDENVVHMDFDIADVVYESQLPQEWTPGQEITNVSEARLMKQNLLGAKVILQGSLI